MLLTELFSNSPKYILKIFTTYLLKKYHLFVYVQEGNIKSNSKQTLDKYGGLNAWLYLMKEQHGYCVVK